MQGGDGLRVGVRRAERAGSSNDGIAVREDIVSARGKAVLRAVEIRDDGPLRIGEGRLLDQNLCAHAGVDTGGGDVFIAAGVDVGGAESDGRSSAIHVVPVVVVVGHSQLAPVLACVAVAVSNEGALPLLGLAL